MGRLSNTPLGCHATRRKLSTCAERIWVRLQEHLLAGMAWPEGDCGSWEAQCVLRGCDRERPLVPASAPGLGLFAQSGRFGHKTIFDPERSFSWVHLLLYDKSACILSACCIHFPGVFASLYFSRRCTKPVPPASRCFPAPVQKSRGLTPQAPTSSQSK